MRSAGYYIVDGVPLDAEMERLRRLPVFLGGPLTRFNPHLTVRRARKRPNRLGFAVPTQMRLSLTAYPGVRAADLLETLLHELTHLHVGRAAETQAWHGRTFKRALAQAMLEAYGVDAPIPRNTRHGVYAAEIAKRWRVLPEDQPDALPSRICHQSDGIGATLAADRCPAVGTERQEPRDAFDHDR